MPRAGLLLMFILGLLGNNAYSQRYTAGDIVENFTLIDRANGQEVSLYDMEGKIVFLEWFAHWCPFCQAAAGDIGPGIVEHYETLNGNPAGLEVMHVGLNLQGGAEPQTQAFVDFFEFGLVLNDFNRAVANRFQSGGQPIFAIINGVADSPTHDQWELLYTRLGYGDLSAPIDTFRLAINSVSVASGEAPMITVHPESQEVETGMELSLNVTIVSDSPASYQWQLDGADIPGATDATLAIPDVGLEDAGMYRVTVTNASGETVSESADISITLGFEDTLIAQGVPEGLRGLADDADGDNVINALEFLSGTDANDASSKESPTVGTQTVDGETYLLFTYLVDPEIRSIVPQVQFSASPGFDTDLLSPVLISEEPVEGGLVRLAYRSSQTLAASSQFARLMLDR